MDLFLAGCQGVGLALAAGMLGGAIAGAASPGEHRPAGLALTALVVAGIGAAYLFGASLDAEDHDPWPGWFVGAALAVFAYAVIRGVVAGAASRAAEGGSPILVAAMMALAALVLAGVSLTPASPAALVAAAALAYLAVARRRRAGEKYEGLRILR